MKPTPLGLSVLQAIIALQLMLFVSSGKSFPSSSCWSINCQIHHHQYVTTQDPVYLGVYQISSHNFSLPFIHSSENFAYFQGFSFSKFWPALIKYHTQYSMSADILLGQNPNHEKHWCKSKVNNHYIYFNKFWLILTNFYQ